MSRWAYARWPDDGLRGVRVQEGAHAACTIRDAARGGAGVVERRDDSRLACLAASEHHPQKNTWGNAMPGVSRRRHLQQLSGVFGAAALSGWSGPARASEADIPPEGIAKGIQHISYSD